MFTDTINMIIKNYFFCIFSMMIFFKISSYKEINTIEKIVVFISTIGLTVIYIFLKNNFDIVMAVFSTYLLQVTLLKIVTKKKLSGLLIGVLISTSLSYVFFSIAAILEFFLQKIFDINNRTINTILTLIIEFIIIHFVLKMKRLKNGLIFLKKTDEYIEMALIDISVFIIVLYGLISIIYEDFTLNILFYFILLSVCMIITIQKILVMYYKQKLIDDTINQYKQDLQDKDNEIKRLTDEAFRVSKINHEFYNRQKALELMVEEKLQNSNMETGEDFDILTRIQNLTSDHAEKVKEIKSLPALQLTNIPEIDDMFTYMQKECKENGIQFKLNINGNIHYLVNNFIPKDKLETLIGDHIRDAIIAINSGDNENKEIFVILGIKDNCYELCIYDTGIEFEIETLLNLGLAPMTTHKDTGGSGIGFMTTFETLNECNASLIIEERHPVDDKDYTKAVKVRFDKKNEYKIYSYRAHEINKMNNNKRLIVCKEYQ